ncbi:acyl-CoA synthetase [Halomonas sp.]|uniref:acyl-CoA synthetase n=1 Tax=Halomonas sp. TaxID=1486246 RepID=UPI00257F83F2|nr:acyl-CoA synthetase [Halomonas sp.]MCJ8284234.1 acyl-CoA synthetase [Halomonas sp.]NQY69286.1 acyl-CoA synthetase [Halomonas sp.]
MTIDTASAAASPLPSYLERIRRFPAIRDRNDIEVIEATPWASLELPDSTLELIQISARRRPDATALRFVMDATAQQQGQRYTYAEFLARVVQAANAFHRLGVNADDVVSFLLPSLPQTHFTLWGGEAAGVVNPINPMLEPEHIAGIMNAAGTRLLVALAPFPGSDIWDKVEAIKDRVPSLEKVLYVDAAHFLGDDEARALRERLPLPGAADWCEDFDRCLDRAPADRLINERRIRPEERASLFHTGGTTGLPKLAPHSHANEVANAAMMQMLFRHREDAVILCGLPLFHVNAVLITGLVPLMIGAEILLATPGGFRSPGLVDNFWSLVERHRVSFFSAVPAIFSRLLEVPFGDAEVSSLKSALSGGAPLPRAVHGHFEELTGISLIEGFGMTEGTCGSMANPLAGERRTGSVGLALPYTGARVVALDDQGRYLHDCAVNEIGTLLIRGPNVFDGYSRPEQNRDIWVEDGWFNTGDLARQDADGYLWITGRAKDLIIRGGHNIDPQMIEDALYRHPAVQMAAAVGKPCERVGELPVAYVSLQPNRQVNEDDLLSHCQAHLAEKAAIPKNIWILDSIPLTAVGKVFKPALRQDAVTRVYGEIADAELGPGVARITACQDATLGLVAEIRVPGDVDLSSLKARLEAFPIPCRWRQAS